MGGEAPFEANESAQALTALRKARHLWTVGWRGVTKFSGVFDKGVDVEISVRDTWARLNIAPPEAFAELKTLYKDLMRMRFPIATTKTLNYIYIYILTIYIYVFISVVFEHRTAPLGMAA